MPPDVQIFGKLSLTRIETTARGSGRSRGRMHPGVMTTKLSESLFFFPVALAMLSAVPGCSSQNGAPELLPIAAQHTSVGSLFELRIQAHDPDGDRLRFGFSSPTEGLDGRARITALAALPGAVNRMIRAKP